MNPDRLRVLSWNVLYRELDARADGIADVIAAVGPDIVLLQETNPDHAEATARNLDLQVVGCGPAAPEPGPTSVPAILVRPSLIDASPGDGGVLADDDKTFAVWRTLTDGPATIVVASVHLTHTFQAGRMALDERYVAAAGGRGEAEAIDDPTIGDSVAARIRQLGALVETLGSEADRAVPIVLGGDFNFVPQGIEYRHLLGAGYADSWEAGPRLGSRDTILEHNPLISDGPGVYTEASGRFLPGTTGPLDYTLDFHFTRNLACRAAWVVGRPDPERPIWHSDHLAVAADYSVEKTGEPSVT